MRAGSSTATRATVPLETATFCAAANDEPTAVSAPARTNVRIICIWNRLRSKLSRPSWCRPITRRCNHRAMPSAELRVPELRDLYCLRPLCGPRPPGVANAGNDGVDVDTGTEHSHVERDRLVIREPAEAAKQVRPIVL